MKSFRLLAVAALICSGATAQADPYPRTSGEDPESAPSPSDVAPLVAAAYPDYPPYPPGFSSYRGLGFMGFCCEPPPRCAEQAWAGYCDQRACTGPQPTLGATLHAWLPRPACSCGPVIGGLGAKGSYQGGWPAGRSHGFGRRLWLQGYPTGLAADGGEGCEPRDAGAEPATAAPAETAEPTPAPLTAEPPAAGPASGTSPSPTAPPAPDRSAWRGDLRRLPRVEGSH